MALALQNPQPNLLDLIRISKHLSASERLFLAKALLDSLVMEEGTEANAAETVDEQNTVDNEAIIREREAYIALHPTLSAQYPNEHVAIHNGELVDHDKDGLALSLRIYQRFPNEFVWIAPLKTDAMEEWVVRSPRFESIP